MSARTSRNGDPAAGFTLIEMLVAVALLASVIALAMSLYTAISGTSRLGGTVASRIDTAARGLAALRHDVQRLQRVVEREKDRDQFVFTGKRGEISFPVVDPSYPTEAGSYIVTYRIRSQKQFSQLVRQRVPYDVVGDTSRRQSSRQRRQVEEEVVVMEGLYEFTFSYLERVDDKVRWVDSWTQPTRLPSLVRFAAKSTEAGRPNLPVMIVEPRINGEFTCLMPQVGLCSPQTAGAIVARKGAAAGPPPTQQ
jgi:prepilin-type N-terminal cleavage/methylation domain-containing protein